MNPRDTAYPVHRLLRMTEEMARQIKEFRFSRRLETDSDATRRLIDLGLEAIQKEDDE